MFFWTSRFLSTDIFLIKIISCCQNEHKVLERIVCRAMSNHWWWWFEGRCLSAWNIFMKVDSCVYQTHPELPCYHEIQGPVETSFSIGNSSQLSWNFRHKIQLGWVEFLLKMMFQLVPVSRGNRPRKTITSCKLEKRRI